MINTTKTIDKSKTPIEQVGFTPRTYKFLKQANVGTIGALTYYTKERLLEKTNSDQSVVAEVEGKLKAYGYKFVTQQELDEMYEDDMKTLQAFLNERNRRCHGQYTHQDLVDLYTSRYVNDKSVKKYAKVNVEEVRKVIDKLDGKYVDLIRSIIYANDVLFSADRGSHCVQEEDANGVLRTKVFARMNEDETRTFYHELGHAGAYCFQEDRELSYYLVGIPDSNGKTLEDVLRQELNANKAKIKEQILEAHKKAVAPTFGQEDYLSIAENASFLKEYNKLARKVGAIGGFYIPSLSKKVSEKDQENREKFLQMQDEISSRGVVANKTRLQNSPEHNAFIKDNVVVLDVLSSVYDMAQPYGLEVHSKSYYKQASENLILEFWANLFAIKVTGRDDLMFKAKTYLPESCKAFEELFDKVVEFYRLQKAVHDWDAKH